MITIYDIANVKDRAEDAGVLDNFLKNVGLEDLLSAEEEQELLARAVEGDEEAADKVMRANLRFVVSIANQYQHKGLSLLQLIDVSKRGLVEAVMASALKPDNQRFVQFAVPYMRKAIEEAIAANKE